MNARTVCASSDLGANKSDAGSRIGNRSTLHLTVPVMQKARALFPVKTSQHLSEITGYSQRACAAWLGEEAKIPADALGALIRSEWGLEFLVSIMERARPWWWSWFLKVGLVASAMRRRAADRRLIERALDADDALAKTMGRAADALLVQDEDFGRVFADGVRSMAGAPDRAMAAAKVKGRKP